MPQTDKKITRLSFERHNVSISSSCSGT